MIDALFLRFRDGLNLNICMDGTNLVGRDVFLRTWFFLEFHGDRNVFLEGLFKVVDGR